MGETKKELGKDIKREDLKNINGLSPLVLIDDRESIPPTQSQNSGLKFVDEESSEEVLQNVSISIAPVLDFPNVTPEVKFEVLDNAEYAESDSDDGSYIDDYLKLMEN